MLIVYVAGMWNWRNPFLRFSDPLPNAIALLGILLLPLILVVLASQFRRVWMRWLWIAALALPSLCSILLGSGTFIVIGILIDTGRDPAFELDRQIPREGYMLSLYRTSSGGLGDNGLVLRQEREIIHGLLLVRDVFSDYSSYDASITILKDGRISIYAPRTNASDQPSEVTLELKDWVYF